MNKKNGLTRYLAVTAALLMAVGTTVWLLTRFPVEQWRASRLEVQAIRELATLIERITDEHHNKTRTSLHEHLFSFDSIGELPTGYQYDKQTNQLKNQWGSEVKVLYSNDMKHYSILYASLPKEACRYLAAQLPYGQLRSMGRGEGINSNNAITITVGHASPFAVNEMCQPDALNGPLYFSTRELL